MKKPVKPTPEILAAAVAKRVTKTKTVYKELRSGNIKSLNDQIIRFASENKVDADEIKFAFGYYYRGMTVRRLETEDEKSKRIKDDLDSAYRVKKYEYDRYVEKQRREVESAKATLNHYNVNVANTTCCKKCSCNCCH